MLNFSFCLFRHACYVACERDQQMNERMYGWMNDQNQRTKARGYVTTTALLTQKPVDCSTRPGQTTCTIAVELASEVWNRRCRSSSKMAPPSWYSSTYGGRWVVRDQASRAQVATKRRSSLLFLIERRSDNCRCLYITWTLRTLHCTEVHDKRTTRRILVDIGMSTEKQVRQWRGLTYPHMPILRPHGVWHTPRDIFERRISSLTFTSAHLYGNWRGPGAGQFVRFWASGEAKFTKICDSLPWTPMNHHAKFDAASFIIGGEIRNRTNTHEKNKQ